MDDRDDRAAAFARCLGHPLGRCPRRQSLIDRGVGAELAGQELPRLAGSEERARQDCRRLDSLGTEPLAERPGLRAAGGGQRPEVVGRPGGRLRMTYEEELHPACQDSSGVESAPPRRENRPSGHNGAVREQQGWRRPRRAGRARSDAERRRLAQASREKERRERVDTPVLWCDGGSRGNPGPAALAYVLDVPGGPRLTCAEEIGRASVNTAEYRAVVAGLERAAALGLSGVEVRLDARVVAQQLTGEREPRNPELRALLEEARRAAVAVRPVRYTWIPREANGPANALVSDALGLRSDTG